MIQKGKKKSARIPRIENSNRTGQAWGQRRDSSNDKSNGPDAFPGAVV